MELSDAHEPWDTLLEYMVTATEISGPTSLFCRERRRDDRTSKKHERKDDAAKPPFFIADWPLYEGGRGDYRNMYLAVEERQTCTVR